MHTSSCVEMCEAPDIVSADRKVWIVQKEILAAILVDHCVIKLLPAMSTPELRAAYERMMGLEVGTIPGSASHARAFHASLKPGLKLAHEYREKYQSLEKDDRHRVQYSGSFLEEGSGGEEESWRRSTSSGAPTP